MTRVNSCDYAKVGGQIRVLTHGAESCSIITEEHWPFLGGQRFVPIVLCLLQICPPRH
jgi:hypothetical protein